MKKNKGITLVALVITIIILLILAGTVISMIIGGEGILAKANEAATKYNQAAKDEAEMINQLLNGNYLNKGGNGQGGEKEPPETPEEPIQEPINNDSHVGYYADLDPEDGKIDGIIFADLAVGGSGQWLEYEEGEYTIPVKTGLKEYYVSQIGYKGDFETKDVLSPKTGSTGEDRFYIMALEDISATTYTWYKEANGKMTDYTTTSVEFGKGKANTTKMIEYWNNKTYGEQSSSDIWGAIQDKTSEGWFVPSRAEWAAFAQELKITETNYEGYGISKYCWSSSQGNSDRTWSVNFEYDCMSNDYVFNNKHVRLATTF